MTQNDTQQAAAHAPEPWFVQPSDHPGGLLIKPIPGQVVGQCDQVPEMETNARRICAAVNACKGIRTESLEQGIVTELLQQLMLLADHLETPPHAFTEAMRALRLREVRAAIAKATAA